MQKGALSAEPAIDHRAKGYALHLCLPCQRAHQMLGLFHWSLPVKRLKSFNKVSIPALHQEADVYGAANHCSALARVIKTPKRVVEEARTLYSGSGFYI